MVLLNVKLILISLSFISNPTLPEDFAYLNEIIPDIGVDLRYFSSDNFVGETIDGYHEKKCIISTEGAKALVNVQNELKDPHPKDGDL